MEVSCIGYHKQSRNIFIDSKIAAYEEFDMHREENIEDRDDSKLVSHDFGQYLKQKQKELDQKKKELGEKKPDGWVNPDDVNTNYMPVSP